MLNTAESQKPIVIVGMGPGGMAAALKLAEKGKKVAILENREEFARIQTVMLSPDSVNFLLSLTTLPDIKLSEFKRSLRALNDKVKDKSVQLTDSQMNDLEFLLELSKNDKKVELHELQEFFKRKMQEKYPNQIEII